MLRWEGKLDEIYLHAGGALLYRLLLDWYVNFYLHFDWSQFEWHPKEFTQLVTPEFPDYYIKDWKVYEKARYGISLYDASYYDPLSPSPIPTKDLERIAWQLRYAFTERDASTPSPSRRRLPQAHRDGSHRITKAPLPTRVYAP